MRRSWPQLRTTCQPIIKSDVVVLSQEDPAMPMTKDEMLAALKD